MLRFRCRLQNLRLLLSGERVDIIDRLRGFLALVCPVGHDVVFEQLVVLGEFGRLAVAPATSGVDANGSAPVHANALGNQNG